jgi:putative transposase
VQTQSSSVAQRGAAILLNQLVNQPRRTQRYHPIQRDDEDSLTRAIIELASRYGRYGYRRSTALL